MIKLKNLQVRFLNKYTHTKEDLVWIKLLRKLRKTKKQ